MDSLIIVAILVVLAGPVLGVIALVSVRRLEGESQTGLIPRLTSRIFVLEQKIADLQKTLSARAPEAVAPVTPEAIPPAALKEQVKVGVPVTPVPAAVATPPPPSPLGQRQVHAQPAGPRTGMVSGVNLSFPHTTDASRVDLESQIAGRWFNRIGIVALLIAVSYFLKLAFDNNWIGESGRVAIGVLLGALMLPWSQWLLGKGYNYFSEGIAALGEATLFLSVWAGCQYYTLYSRDVGFAAMIAITMVTAVVAIGRNSQRIAVLSLLGGLLTPILVSSGKDQQLVLFTYLILLGMGALVIEWKKDWKALTPIAFIGTQIYFWGWYADFFHRTSPLERTVVFATLFYLLFSALPIFKAMGDKRAGELDIAMILMNTFAYSGTLYILLWPQDKWPLTLLFLALAAGHVAVARLLPLPKQGETGTVRLLFAGLALTFLTLAIPVRLEGKWITLSFSVEGAILVWTGFREASNFLRQAGYLLLAISALRLLVVPPNGGAFLFNERFGAYAVLIACFGIALWAARSHESAVAGQERAEVGIFAVAINVYALIALSTEFWDYFGKASVGVDSALAQHLALSILWTAYASGLLFLGVQNKSALLRWQSLVLFGLVVGKVFLYDLSFLERGYRILSFFVLGAVLLGVSFLYQRKLTHKRESS
ncbi:MAG TPA: DUF2339 domain-containing protein [Candidatus Acidoferrum sp.]|jgi:uncharacterized membrane protein